MLRDTRMRIAALCDPLDSSSIDSTTHRVDALPLPIPQLLVDRNALASLDAAIALERQQQQQQQQASLITPSVEQNTLPSAPTTTTAAKRSKRMSNSARGKLYRSRRKKFTDGLGEHVEALRREVVELQLYHRTQRDLFVSQPCYFTPATTPFVRIVREYFALFEHGVPVIPATTRSDDVAFDAMTQSSLQASFLDAMVSPDITFGGERGVRLLLEQWERYSLYHGSLQFVLQRLDVVVADAANAVVSARAVLRVRFSRVTLEKVFPHVLWNAALVQKLIGMEMDYPVGNTFYFGTDGRIVAYTIEVDFVATFAAALGSLDDALELVGHARIKQQHMIVDEADDGIVRVDSEMLRDESSRRTTSRSTSAGSSDSSSSLYSE